MPPYGNTNLIPGKRRSVSAKDLESLAAAFDLKTQEKAKNHDEEVVNPEELIFQRLYAQEEEEQHGRRPTAGRTLYLSRHGESMYNLENRIGGNPALSPQGQKYASALAERINGMDIEGLKIWTSDLKRTHQTAADISCPHKTSLTALNELDSGDYDDLTYEEFEGLHPAQFKQRETNKLTYRYPNGESYVDLCRRVETVLPAMNTEHNLLVICHQAVIRCILAYLLKKSGEEVPFIKVPLHTIMKVTLKPNGQNEITFERLPIDCVDTYRPKQDEAQLEKNSAEKQLEKGESLNMRSTTTIMPKSNSSSASFVTTLNDCTARRGEILA